MRIAWQKFTRAMRGLGAGTGRDSLGGEVAPVPVIMEPSGPVDDGLPMGVYPEDADAVPYWWHAAKGWHDTWGMRYTAPPTKRAHAAALAAIEAAERAEDAEILFPPLSADEAARRLLDYLQADLEHETLVLTSDELGEIYEDWCRNVEHRRPAPDNFVRAAFKRLSSVRSKQVVIAGEGRTRKVWTYTVFPASAETDTVAETDTLPFAQPLPIEAQPLRRVA